MVKNKSAVKQLHKNYHFTDYFTDCIKLTRICKIDS